MKCQICLCDKILFVEVGFATSGLSSSLTSLTNQLYHLVDVHQRCPHMSQVCKNDLSWQPFLAFSGVQLGGRDSSLIDRNFMHFSVLEASSSFFTSQKSYGSTIPGMAYMLISDDFLTDAHMEHWSFPLSVTWIAICGGLNKNSTCRL